MSTTTGHAFTICSCNIYQLPLFTDTYRVFHFCNKILKTKPTTVCIQEAWTSTIINIILVHLRKIYKFSISAQTHANLKRSGIMILSIIPIQYNRFIKFKHLGGFPDSITRKGLLIFTLNDTVKIGVTHNVASYKYFPTNAPLQNLELINRMINQYDVQLLIGDLNISDPSIVYNILGGKHIIHGVTERLVIQQLDYCIIFNKLQEISTRIIDMKGVSDHQMLYARLLPLQNLSKSN
jgi:hypothetical protein